MVPFVLLAGVTVSIALLVFGVGAGLPGWILTIAVFVLPVLVAIRSGGSSTPVSAAAAGNVRRRMPR